MPHDPPSLSRARLESVLGLGPGASKASLMRAAMRLLTRLEDRLEGSAAEERAALQREIQGLSESTLHWGAMDATSDAPGTGRWAVMGSSRLLRVGIALLVLGAMAIAAFQISAAMRRETAASRRVVATPALLIVESRPVDAVLRILDPESQELLLKIPSEGVRVELESGQYDLEVSREDCPDRWARSIELEAGETRRYEPAICSGAGELVVRSNVIDDRLRIDEFDVGSTRVEAHLVGVGDHLVRVDKRGYESFQGTVRIRPGERQELRVHLLADADGGHSAPLPFAVVSPSPPPPLSDQSFKPELPDLSSDFAADPIVPEPFGAAPLDMPSPLFDLASGDRRGAPPEGGSTSWHDLVTQQVLARFDLDGSGRIDRSAETEAIPCSFWVELGRSFDQGRLGLSMSRLYGFDGTEWHPNALGFAREQRTAAYQRMKACGLES